MGANIKKVQYQPQIDFSYVLKSQISNGIGSTVLAVKFPSQHFEQILSDINDNSIVDLTIVNSSLQYRRARYLAKLRKRPIQNILAVTPTAWEEWDNLADEIFSHSGSNIFLFDNSMEASYCADKEVVLDAKGEVIVERNLGCFC